MFKKKLKSYIRLQVIFLILHFLNILTNITKFSSVYRQLLRGRKSKYITKLSIRK